MLLVDKDFGAMPVARVVAVKLGERLEWAMSSTVETERWKQLYLYWLSKHVDGRPPRRRDIDPPLEIPRLVANMMLIDVVAARFRYRLVGSTIWDRFQSELTGTWIERRNPPEAAWRAVLVKVRDDRVARLVSTEVPGYDDRFHVAVAMPLVGDNGRTKQLLAGIFFAQEFGNNLRVSGELMVREVLTETAL